MTLARIKKQYSALLKCIFLKSTTLSDYSYLFFIWYLYFDLELWNSALIGKKKVVRDKFCERLVTDGKGSITIDWGDFPSIANLRWDVDGLRDDKMLLQES